MLGFSNRIMRAWRRVTLKEYRYLPYVLTLLVISIMVAGARGNLAVTDPGKEPGESSGIDQPALDRLVKEAERTHTDALVVMKDGKLVGEWYFGKKRGPIETMSMTKSVVSMAIGRLLTEHKLKSIDEPVWTFFPEWKQGQKEKVTIKHLLNHTSGIKANPNVDFYQTPDFVKLALAAELANPPGTHFFYNNKAVNILPGIVEKASGKKIDAYLGAAVFAPLGIKRFSWTHDRAGNPHGMAGLQMSARDLAKLGQLMLDKGCWKGEQIIAADYVEESVKPAQDFDASSGLLWWIASSYRKHLIEDSTLTAWKKAGMDDEFLGKLANLKGKAYSSKELETSVQSQAGADAFKKLVALINSGYPQPRIVTGPCLGFAARGYLGQALIVLTGEHLVVVRQIRKESHKSEEDDFPELDALVHALVKTPEPAVDASASH